MSVEGAFFVVREYDAQMGECRIVEHRRENFHLRIEQPSNESYNVVKTDVITRN